MTTHATALLAAILADPADDSARVVYADALEEEGQQERAEFIRQSIHDQHGGQYSADANMAREFRPLAGWEDMPDSIDGSWTVQIHRGFIRFVRCTCQSWLTHGPAIVRCQPIERVEITDMPIYPSGGNSTYYVGGLGQFPQKFWRELDSLPTRHAAANALSDVALAWAKAQPLIPPAAASVT